MGSGDWFKTLISRKSKERKPKKGKGTLASAKLSALNSNDCTRRDSSDLANGAKAENIGSVETLLQQESRLHSGLIRKALRRLKGIIKLQIVTQSYSVKKQANTAITYLHSWSKIQTEIRARRIYIVTEDRIRRKKLEN
ncbi:hypothetical protein HN51_001023 [Arachis hypogaea]